MINLVLCLFLFVSCGCFVEKWNFKFNVVEVCYLIFWINVKFFIEIDVFLVLLLDCKILFCICLILINIIFFFIFVLLIGIKILM